jgi:hypothetical protein
VIATDECDLSRRPSRDCSEGNTEENASSRGFHVDIVTQNARSEYLCVGINLRAGFAEFPRLLFHPGA